MGNKSVSAKLLSGRSRFLLLLRPAWRMRQNRVPLGAGPLPARPARAQPVRPIRSHL